MSRKVLLRLAERFTQPTRGDLVDAINILGISQAKLSREIGVSPAFVSQILSGAKQLPPDKSEKIAALLKKKAERP